MLNNRLEDLIYIYKKYRMRLFFRYILFIFLSFIMIGGIIYTFKRAIPIEHKKSIKVAKKQIKVREIIKPKPKPRPKPKPEPIDEDKAMDKNSFKALMSIEKNKPTYESAVDLAEYFFEKNNFQKASKWAMVATNRDEKIDKAWLLYAKSKIKLGQKGIAKKALKIYLLKYHSQKVENLLNSL